MSDSENIQPQEATRQPGSAAAAAFGEGGQEHSRFILLLCYLAALGAFGSLVNDLYLPTLPEMQREFHTSTAEVQLGLSFVMLGLGFGELFWGPLSDERGRKPVLSMSLILFIAASLASVFSPTIEFFIICRLFQGLGASGAVLLSRTIPTDEFRGRELAKIMAMVGAINGIAPVSGPLFGGMLADTIGWRGIFILLAAIGLGMFCCGLKLHETLPPERRQQGTLPQMMASCLPLLKNRPFMVHVMLKGATLGVLFSYIASGPFIIQTHYGFSAFEFGLFFGGNALSIIAGSVICLRFSTMKKAAIVGCAGMTAFAVAEALAIWHMDNVWVFELLILPMLLFTGIVLSASNTLAMSEGARFAGSASAILGLAGYVFGSVVSPLVGLGDIMRSTCLALIVCAAIALFFAHLAYRLPAMKYQP